MVDFDLGSRGTKLKAEQERRLREARKKLEQERRAKAAADAHAAEVQAQLKQKRLEQLRKEEEVPLIANLRNYLVSKCSTLKATDQYLPYCWNRSDGKRRSWSDAQLAFHTPKLCRQCLLKAMVTRSRCQPVHCKH
jgi:hypothetical protein